MSDYTQMAKYYDLIMTSGYYDYDRIVDHLFRFDQAGSVLEIGAGTGLILERLAARRPHLEITGIDLTQAMLDIAIDRLRGYPQVSLKLQNVVTLSMDRRYDIAFSYGGVWYFVPEDDTDTRAVDGTQAAADGQGSAADQIAASARNIRFSLVSHLRDNLENHRGLERIADHLPAGGILLLGIQAPHADYARSVSNGMEYAQRIAPIRDGFRKHYSLADDGRTVMEQTTEYRVYEFEDAIELLDKAGFEYRAGSPGPASHGAQPSGGDDGLAGLFLEFCKR